MVKHLNAKKNKKSSNMQCHSSSKLTHHLWGKKRLTPIKIFGNYCWKQYVKNTIILQEIKVEKNNILKLHSSR